jgi:hypothetical protein
MLDKKVIDSIYNKRIEIHYNEWVFKANGETIKIDLKGKIKCPVFNSGISSLTCSKLMDREDWPRGIDPLICKKCDCFIALSIKKYQEIKKEKKVEPTDGT